MHAVVVRVTISDPEAGEARLREQVVPRVSQAPGFVAAYWTRKDNTGLSMSVWESEDAANTASEMVRSRAWRCARSWPAPERFAFDFERHRALAS
jgi:heme-degrading monooxygenase HmoA